MVCPSNSEGRALSLVSRMRAELCTSVGVSSWPVRTSAISSSISRRALFRSVSSPPVSITSLPRTCTCTRGNSRWMLVSSRSCGPSNLTIAIPSMLRRTTSASAVAAGAAADTEAAANAAVAGTSGTTKGSLLQSATEHVRVHVKHRLPRIFPGIENQPELTVTQLHRDIRRDSNKLGEQSRVARGEFNHGAGPPDLGGNNHVNRRLRRNVIKGDNPLGLGSDRRRNFPQRNALEDGACVVGHDSIVPRFQQLPCARMIPTTARVAR